MLQLAVTAHVEVANEVVLADSSLLRGLIRLHSVPASLGRIGGYRFRGCQSAGMPAVVQPVSRRRCTRESATGSTSVIAVMSVARQLFHRKRKSTRDRCYFKSAKS